MKRREFLAAVPAACAPLVLSADRASAADSVAPAVHLRMATLAPNGSSWMRVFSAWKNTVEKRTEGAVRMTFFPGGTAGDERDVVRKMRAGQLDGAALTTAGLGQIVRPVLVLQAAGACQSYLEIDAVRTELASDFALQFERSGYKLLGWGDAGSARIFSKRPITSPEDMRQTRMWSWIDDPNWQSILSVCNVTGVALGLPEVYPALRTHRINAFPGTAIAAVAFQWHTEATHVTRDPIGVVVGAVIIDSKKYAAIPAELQAAVIETAQQANQLLAQRSRSDDQAALDAIVARGIQLVDTSKEREAWDTVNRKAREALAGKLYPVEFLHRVESIALEARRK